MKNQNLQTDQAISLNGMLGNRLSDEQIDNAIKNLDNISSFIKEEKRLLTEEFYKDKSLLGKPISEWRKIQAKFETLWTVKEEILYAMISKVMIKKLKPGQTYCRCCKQILLIINKERHDIGSKHNKNLRKFLDL